MLKRFDREVTNVGGNTNDLAYANAVAVKLAFEVYRQVDLNKAQFASVLTMMGEDIATMPEFQAMSDNQKQDLFDSIVYRTMKIYDEYESANEKVRKSSGDSYASLGEGYNAVNKLESLESDALRWLLDIFQPRNFADYQLKANGFVKVK